MKKYNVGYTTGVFDLFHIGHLNILRQAKEMCEYLIVGVSTNELVQEYKKKTPIISFEERVAIVQACRYVDRVVPQISMNKLDVWPELQFNVLFHGDEWKGSTLYNDYIEQFKEVGVEVVFFSSTKGISTSALAQKLTTRQGH